MGDAEKGGHGFDSGLPFIPDDLDASCAKLWSVYISEAEKYDKALVESWRGDMDGMLIFAGLFSASLTAFIIESYKTLTPDSGNTTAAMLAQISNQLAASASGTTFEAPPPAVFVVPATSIICNILWFISLGLSLSCALIATLVEQWARDFVQKADMRPAPVIRARIFSYLYYGLKRFNMHALVDLVPLLLHMSLVLFFAGLVAFLLPINRTVMAVAAALLGIVVAIYCVLTVLPLVYFDCPYRTPFSTVLWRTSQFWQRIYGLAAMRFGRFGRPRASVGHAAEETMVEVMISQATRPSKSRDKRDQHSLCWTMKSLVDGTELEPFIAGIPDVLWGPKGRKDIHDHLIRTLLDDPDVRLGYRLLDLMRHADSGLLAPDVEVRYKTSCLKALWSIAALSERGTPLNLPLHDFAHQLQLWSRSPSRSRSETCDFLDNHLPTVQAVICWCILCSFDAIFQNLKSDLEGCKAEVAAPCFPSAGTVQSALCRMLEHSQYFHATLRHMSPNLKGGLISAGDANQLQVLANASLQIDPGLWIQNVWSFVNDSEDYWDNARHSILSGFLGASLSPYDRPNTIYKFNPTLEILRDFWPPPTGLQTGNYVELFDGHAIWDRPFEGQGLPNPQNTSVLAVVMSILFPVLTTSRPAVIGLDGTNNLLSYIRVMMRSRSSYEVLRTALDDANITLLWDAIMEYLRCGSLSYTTERTLEVMCDFYQWLYQTYDLMDINNRSELDRYSESLPQFNESTLLALEPPHVCPPYHSILALVKTRILLSLMNRKTKIFERLDKGEIMAFSPEFHERLAERWRLLRGIPLADAEASESFTIRRSPQNVVPTQSDWDESIAFLSHPLLSESSLGELGGVLENDPNFDFKDCGDAVQKGAQYLNLLFTVSGRLHDANAVVHAEFLEACASRAPPYSALNILTNHVGVPALNILLAHPTHRNRFANSIQALMKVRSPTREQTMTWQHLLRESSILGVTLKPPEPFSPTIRAYGDSYDQTAVLVIKGALREYASSIRESSDAATSMKERVQDRLNDLDALLNQLRTVGAIPVNEQIVPEAGV